MGKTIKNPLSKAELEKLYLEDKLSAIEIGALVGVKYQQIYYLLGKYDIPRRSMSESHRPFSVNDEYFDRIDNDEKAYWLGFIYADGFINNLGYVGITLKDTDIKHLEAFNKAISSTYPIHQYCVSGNHSYSPCHYARIIFKSEHMVQSLIQKGCLPHKSLILKWPTEDQIPSQFLGSFLLGYIDGDGCLTFCDKAHRQLRIKICGTKEFLTDLIAYLNTVIAPQKMNPSLEKRHQDQKNTYSITIGGSKRACFILSTLYKNSPVCLERKQKIFQKHCMSTVEPIRNDGCLTL